MYEKVNPAHPDKVADRIEEAWRETCGNAAAMREALEEMATELEDLASRDGIRAPAYSSIFSIYAEKSRKALAAPPRNCDVGTAEEQDARLWSYCAETRCGDTLCRNGNCSLEDIRMCALRWAQMPYESDAKK